MAIIIRRQLLFTLLLVMASAQGADLVEVYEQAEATNPTLAAAAANLRAVQETRPQAIAGLLPVISADGSYSRKRFKPRNPSEDATFSNDKIASLDLVQPLFRFDRWIQLKQSDSEIAAAEAEFVAAQQDLMVKIAERYFKVLDAEDNVEFAKAEKSSIGRQLEQATQRFEVGLIAITDVTSAQARYDLSTSQEIRVISELVQAKDSLREIAGRYYDDLAKLKPDLELVAPDPSTPEDWIDKAMQQNLQVLAAQANSETARQEIRRQRAGHLPTLDMNASIRYIDNEFGGLTPVRRDDSEIGVQLRIPIYEGGLVNSRTREARDRFQQSSDQLEQAVREAELGTRNAFRSVLTDIAQVNALQQSVKSTKIAVEGEEAGHEVGTRTIVDVLNAQREYYLAVLNYARARYLYVVDQLRLKRAAGILNFNDIEEVNRSLAAEK